MSLTSALPSLGCLISIPWQESPAASLPFRLPWPQAPAGVPASLKRLDSDLSSLSLAPQAMVAQRAWHKPARRLRPCQSQQVCACLHRSQVGDTMLPCHFSLSVMLKRIGGFFNRTTRLPSDRNNSPSSYRHLTNCLPTRPVGRAAPHPARGKKIKEALLKQGVNYRSLNPVLRMALTRSFRHSGVSEVERARLAEAP